MILLTLSWSLPNFWEDLRRRWSISIGSVLSSLFSVKKEVEESCALHLIVLVSFPTSISVSSCKLPLEHTIIYCDINEYLGFTQILNHSSSIIFFYVPNISFTAVDEHFVVHMIGAGVSIMPPCLGGIILTDGLEGRDSSSSFLMLETL